MPLPHAGALPSVVGGLVYFGCHASDGLLYEIVDEDGKLLLNVTIESLVEDWKANT